jgi:hypothetical protein
MKKRKGQNAAAWFYAQPGFNRIEDEPIRIVHVIDPADPTPWCTACGAKTREKCNCGPIADNN